MPPPFPEPLPPPASSAHHTAHAVFRGMAFAFFGFICFSLQDAFMQQTTRLYPSMQIVWLNSFMVLVCALAYLFIRKGHYGTKLILKTGHMKIHLLRGSLLAAGMCLGFYAISHVPLPNFYSIIFIGPLVATLLSGVFLHEPVGWKKAMAVAVGFVGLLIALQPGPEGFNAYALYVLGAALIFATTALLSRFLGRKDAAPTLIIYPMFMVTLLLAPPVLADFKPIAPEHLLPVFLTGFFATIAFSCNAKAYSLAPIYYLAPCQFLQFLWGSLIHAFVNKAYPEPQVVMGAGIIIFSNIFVIALQRMQKK